MIRYSVAVVAAVVCITSEAAAIECAAEAPRTHTGRWSWRTIDGKKCWYPGAPGMSKDKLRWPDTTVGQRGGQPSDSAPATVAPRAMRNAVQPNARDNAPPQRALTFRERWPH